MAAEASTLSSSPTSAFCVLRPEEKMIERYHIFLEAFTEYMITQNTKFISSMTEHHTMLQALTTAQARQNIEQQRSHLDNQRQAQDEVLSEQRLASAAIKNLSSVRHENPTESKKTLATLFSLVT
ncbi:hypothetical protein EDD21DRAFT_416399 [Dissophora ornata]|nr:hypothetical protein EDD21DRAFT_416399 [Dissophora ornata]